MNEEIKKFCLAKKFVISDYLIKVAFLKELNLNEFLILLYLDNDYKGDFDIELMSKNLGMDVGIAMESFNSLMIKGLVNLESVKDIESRFNEVVNLDGVYNLIVENTTEEVKDEVKEDVFKVFERELGRTISSYELELINGWLISGTPEEIVLGALREAIYNGVSNFRYIDKIIYEWEKKGFKTMDDVNKHIRSRRDDKNKDKVITKKEQDILDYDWLDG